jgi:replicative DNA helicase
MSILSLEPVKPHQRAAQDLLGAMIQYPEDTVLEVLAECDNPEILESENYRHVFRAIKTLSHRNEPINIVSLSKELNKSGFDDPVAFLTDLAAGLVTGPVNAMYHLRVVMDSYQERAGIIAAHQFEADIRGIGFEEAHTKHQARLNALIVSQGFKAPSMMDIAADVLRDIEDRAKQPDKMSGLSTGITKLDLLTNGFQRGHLNIIGGLSGMAKTALACQFGRIIAKYCPVGFFSLEMPPKAITRRMLASETLIKLWQINSGAIPKERLPDLYKGIARIAELQLHFADRDCRSLRKIEQTFCRMVTVQKVQIVFIDYIGLITTESRGQNREQQIAEISGTLKSLAMKFDVPIVALTQLNREVERRENKRPCLSDIRESGAIGHDADLVILLFRPDYYDSNNPDRGLAELHVVKGRECGTGIIKLQWNPDYQLFSNLSEVEK